MKSPKIDFFLEQFIEHYYNDCKLINYRNKKIRTNIIYEIQFLFFLLWQSNIRKFCFFDFSYQYSLVKKNLFSKLEIGVCCRPRYTRPNRERKLYRETEKFHQYRNMLKKSLLSCKIYPKRTPVFYQWKVSISVFYFWNPYQYVLEEHAYIHRILRHIEPQCQFLCFNFSTSCVDVSVSAVYLFILLCQEIETFEKQLFLFSDLETSEWLSSFLSSPILNK